MLLSLRPNRLWIWLPSTPFVPPRPATPRCKSSGNLYVGFLLLLEAGGIFFFSPKPGARVSSPCDFAAASPSACRRPPGGAQPRGPRGVSAARGLWAAAPAPRSALAGSRAPPPPRPRSAPLSDWSAARSRPAPCEGIKAAGPPAPLMQLDHPGPRESVCQSPPVLCLLALAAPAGARHHPHDVLPCTRSHVPDPGRLPHHLPGEVRGACPAARRKKFKSHEPLERETAGLGPGWVGQWDADDLSGEPGVTSCHVPR